MLLNGHDEQELRRKARAALDQGLIPRDRPRGLWGGNGAGVPCPVCGIPVDAAEMELENTRCIREFHLHLPCFAAWEIERRTR